MKAGKVLAAVLIPLAIAGCQSGEKLMQPQAAAPRPPHDQPADEGQARVERLLDAHHETVGQIRVSSALRAQQLVDCN